MGRAGEEDFEVDGAVNVICCSTGFRGRMLKLEIVKRIPSMIALAISKPQ